MVNRFDSIAREMARGSLSRRQLLGIAIGTTVAAAVGTGAMPEIAANASTPTSSGVSPLVALSSNRLILDAQICSVNSTTQLISCAQGKPPWPGNRSPAQLTELALSNHPFQQLGLFAARHGYTHLGTTRVRYQKTDATLNWTFIIQPISSNAGASAELNFYLIEPNILEPLLLIYTSDPSAPTYSVTVDTATNTFVTTNPWR